MATCNPSGEIHLNDIGTVFEVTVKDNSDNVVDISSASVMQIHFARPDKTTFTKTAVLSTDGSDGKMKYETVDGDLDQVGRWRLQGDITLLTGTWSTTISTFRVYTNIA